MTQINTLVKFIDVKEGESYSTVVSYKIKQRVTEPVSRGRSVFWILMFVLEDLIDLLGLFGVNSRRRSLENTGLKTLTK